MLKNLITKSAGYYEEDTKLMYEGIVEERKERERILFEERKRRDNLELKLKFRQLFVVTHQKSSDKTWRDFYQEVQTFFNGWIEELTVKTIGKLRDLMIADQMKKRAHVEFKERHLDDWPSINCPVELAEKLEEFEDVRRRLKQKTHTLTPVRRPEVRELDQAEHFRKFDNHNTRKTGNFNPERRYLDTPPSRDFDRRAPRRYVTYVIP
ncbi:peptidase A2 domain-containing protein [Trichonephila clavipes]|nr:peptidase A2 domain-containing protein [Trichonephila clavipes]